MSEWIRFTFSTDDDFRSRLELRMDGALQSYVDEDGETQDYVTHVGGDKPTADIWCEVPDHTATATDNHVIQVNIIQWQGDTDPSISLESIELSGEVHTPVSASINNEVTKWNVITPEFQSLIDAGDNTLTGGVAPGSTETADLGYGSQSFYKTNWAGDRVLGKGSWQLAFSCPYMDWYTTVHQD